MKKKRANLQKRKKQKTEADQPEILKGEVLEAQTLREGMLLLGCVIEIRSNCFLMSLPGCLVGRVPLSHVSKTYSDVIRSMNEEEDEVETDLNSIVELGALYPCKILSVSLEDKKKPSIVLSISPQDVNAELRLSSLYLKMVLHAAVQSIEDHGYVMDIGVKGSQGFLPFSASSGQRNLSPGQVIPASVRKLPSQKGGNVVWLSELNFNDQFPEVEDDTLKLTSLLPGTNIATYITEIKNPFLYGKCMDFNACANAVSLGNQRITEACKVSGTLLYVHPITHMLYLLLGPKPTPNSFKNFFKVKKFDLLKNVKYQHSWHHRLFFKGHHGTMGYVQKNEIEKTDISADGLLKNPVVPMARVVFLHYMDKLLHLSFNNKMLKLDIVRLEDVQIGDIYKATVKRHASNGMFVTICVGLSGFVRQIHLSDALITMPEKLHPVGSQVNCRVLSFHPQFGLNITCKESLLNLPSESILKSYEQAHPGQMYKGIIVQNTDAFILVLFFNNVKGVVPYDHIPESSIFFVGQTVSCHILHCKPEKQKLKLTLLGDEHFPQHSSTKMQSQIFNETKTKKMLHSEKQQFKPKKKHQAVIKSITGHQVNVLLNGGLIGRVHVTELGCSEENFMPLKQFKATMDLKVHVIGTNTKKSVNYLAVSHQNMKHFCECSFEYPPPVPLQKEFCSGMSLIGFVKEIGDTAASLWLSPTQTGTLDYLHFSDNPKILRKLKKKLKIGLSLTVNILDVEKKNKEKSGMSKISLAKTDKKQIKAGVNTVGLVQVASSEKGLILKLPYGYHGVVCLTDLQDVFAPVQAELEKCRKLRFILCHILEVDHNTKFCHLSLRRSRLYNLQESGLKGIQPELRVTDLELGKKVKGFIKSVSGNCIILNIGCKLDGKVSLHKCLAYGCSLCKHSQNTLLKYSSGDVLEVVVTSVKPTKGLYSLSLPELTGLGANQQSRLNVTKDIDWNEL